MKKTTGIERIEGYKKLLPEAEALPEISGKNEMVSLLKKNIRTEEMAMYRKYYFERHCYFGLLLIQSQVFENQIKNLITSCELYLSKSNQASKKYQYRKELNMMTLGELIEGPFSYYIQYRSLLLALKEFNKFRKKIIHKLVEDYNTELSSLESEIAKSYIVNDYTNIESMILEATIRINLRVGKITAPNMEVIDYLHKVMKDMLNLDNEDIKFRFDS